MIQHIVAISWNSDLPENHVAILVEKLPVMARQIESVVEFRCGPDLRVSSQVNADFLIVAVFNDLEGWRLYDQHPIHEEMRAKYLRPYIASRVGAQISF